MAAAVDEPDFIFDVLRAGLHGFFPLYQPSSFEKTGRMNRDYPALIGFFGLAVILAFFAGRGFEREAVASASEGGLERILGSSKEIIGDTMFLKADEYLHGGVVEKFQEPAGSAEREGMIH